VLLVLLAVVQVVLVARDQIAVLHAAREGARAAAVAADSGAGPAAAQAALGLDVARASIDEVRLGDRVRVTVRYDAPTDVPLVGALLGDVTVTATATMRVEP
jgi:hypothetical protein